MALDNLAELEQPIKVQKTIFQNIVGKTEIGLFALALVGIFFKIESFPYAAKMIVISFLGLAFVYAILPIFLFRSKKLEGIF